MIFLECNKLWLDQTELLLIYRDTEPRESIDVICMHFWCLVRRPDNARVTMETSFHGDFHCRCAYEAVAGLSFGTR